MTLKRILTTDYVRLNPRGCHACMKCMEACPRGVIGKVGFLLHRHVIIANADACIGCRRCVKACRRGCFTAVGIDNPSK